MIPILLTTTLFIANSPSLQNRKYNSESRTANRAENGLTNQVRRGIEKKKKRKENTNYRREKETSDTRIVRRERRQIAPPTLDTEYPREIVRLLTSRTFRFSNKSERRFALRERNPQMGKRESEKAMRKEIMSEQSLTNSIDQDGAAVDRCLRPDRSASRWY